MNVRAFFIFVAVLAIAYAIGFLLIPTTLTTLYGDAGGPPVNLAYRFFGVTLLGVGLIFWLAKDCEDPTAISVHCSWAVLSAMWRGRRCQFGEVREAS
jgi:hypothetical protein